jgi:hypothetical protein
MLTVVVSYVHHFVPVQVFTAKNGRFGQPRETVSGRKHEISQASYIVKSIIVVFDVLIGARLLRIEVPPNMDTLSCGTVLRVYSAASIRLYHIGHGLIRHKTTIEHITIMDLVTIAPKIGCHGSGLHKYLHRIAVKFGIGYLRWSCRCCGRHRRRAVVIASTKEGKEAKRQHECQAAKCLRRASAGSACVRHDARPAQRVRGGLQLFVCKLASTSCLHIYEYITPCRYAPVSYSPNKSSKLTFPFSDFIIFSPTLRATCVSPACKLL